MYPEPNLNSNRETDDAVYFFTPPFYPLDNFSAHAINIWGTDFPTSEHAYQWKKYAVDQPELAEQILNAKSPHAVKKISDANKDQVPTEWHEHKVNIMEEILRAKADQHEDVMRKLIKTENKTIVENSPVDGFWGIADGTGQNMLGKTWMKIRDSLK